MAVLLTIHVYAPDPEGPDTWYAAVEELSDADGGPSCFAEGVHEAQAIARAQAAALEYLADELRSGVRGAMDIFDSVTFVVADPLPLEFP